MSLPSIKPQRDSGLTSNCSSVPRSRSRTSDIAVAKIVAICSTTPMTPGHKKVRAAHRRVVEHLRAHLDRHSAAPGLLQQHIGRIDVSAMATDGVQRRQRDVEFEPSISTCDARGAAGAQIAREVGRNLQARRRPCPARIALASSVTLLDFAHDAEGLRVHESVDELAALHRAVLVQHHHRHVLHVGVQRVAEGDHLDQRRKEHEEQRQRIAQHDDEFLVREWR